MTTYCYRCEICNLGFDRGYPFGKSMKITDCPGCGGRSRRDFRSETKTLRVPFFFHNTQSDFLPPEVIGASKVSKEFRKYAHETQGKREL